MGVCVRVGGLCLYRFIMKKSLFVPYVETSTFTNILTVEMCCGAARVKYDRPTLLQAQLARYPAFNYCAIHFFKINT